MRTKTKPEDVRISYVYELDGSVKNKLGWTLNSIESAVKEAHHIGFGDSKKSILQSLRDSHKALQIYTDTGELKPLHTSVWDLCKAIDPIIAAHGGLFHLKRRKKPKTGGAKSSKSTPLSQLLVCVARDRDQIVRLFRGLI